MTGVQLEFDFRPTPPRPATAAPAGFRMLADNEPLMEGDRVWCPNEYAPKRSPWVAIIALHDSNSMRDAPAIRPVAVSGGKVEAEADE